MKLLIFYLRFFLDLFLPQVCLKCQKVSEALYCKACLPSAFFLQKHYIKAKKPLKRVCVLSFYEGEVKHLLQKLKFDAREDCAALLRTEISPFLNEFLLGFDVVFLMPSHWLRRSSRGFNPVECLFELPEVYKKNSCLLLRKKWGLPSYFLSRKRRKIQLKEAFELLDEQVVMRKKVLIIDDIISSQATLQAAANCCLKAGALQVEALGLAYQK